jgi:hypothetical protein
LTGEIDGERTRRLTGRAAARCKLTGEIDGERRLNVTGRSNARG